MGVALEVVAVERRATLAVHPQILRDIGLKPRHRHDDFERRPRCQLRLYGVVQQRMVRIEHVLLPQITRDAHRERIRIEYRPAHQRQHLAGMRIHRNNRAIAIAQRMLRRPLNIQINRQLQILPRRSMLAAQTPHFAAMAVDQDVS